MESPGVGFARWRSDQPSGGNRYDERLTEALRARGVRVREHGVGGTWPVPSAADRRDLATLLGGERDWLIGNIIASAVPGLVASHVDAGARLTVLLHYFPADDPGLPDAARRHLAAAEGHAVRAASAVVVTSAWAAAEVAARYGRQDAVVAAPGTDPAGAARGGLGRGGVPGLLWLGRLTPGKDPLTFVDALARVRDLDWTARLAGPDTVDPALTARVRDRIDRAGLAGRVRVPGPLIGPGLDQAWDGTDLLVHTSRAETYGMVVAEALARGIPSLVAAGTGAQEALRAGAAFAPGDVETLAGTLRSWLTDGRLRERWRRDAAAGRATQAGWEQTATAVWGALTSGTARGPRPPGPGVRPTPRARTRPGPAA